MSNNEDYLNSLGLPVEFKDSAFKGKESKFIKVYPITLDKLELYDSLMHWSWDRRKFNDFWILKMSYFKFLWYIVPRFVDESGKIIYPNIRKDILELLKYVLKVNAEDITIGFEGIPLDDCNDYQVICNQKIDVWVKNEYYFTDTKLDNLFKLVIRQNDFLIPDYTKFSVEMQEFMEQTLREKAKNQKQGATLGEKILLLNLITGTPLEQIGKYTFYQFNRLMALAVRKLDYELYKPLEVSGQISFDKGNEIEHWLDHYKPKGYWDGIIMDANDVEKSVGAKI